MFLGALEPLKFFFGPQQFLSHDLSSSKEIVSFGNQRRRDSDVARA
jgi:hypothetical protein